LKIRGEVNCSTLSAATRIVYAYERTGVPVAGLLPYQPSIQQLSQSLERHPRLRDSADAGGHHGPILALSRSMVVGLHYLFASADTDDADTFFTRLTDGEGLAAGDPIYTLRDRMIRELRDHKQLTPTVLTAFTIRAFGAWRNGERLTKFQWKPGGAHPDRPAARTRTASPRSRAALSRSVTASKDSGAAGRGVTETTDIDGGGREGATGVNMGAPNQAVLDQFWECPKCGTQASMGAPARMSPPLCSWGHPTTEMEQTTAPRFGHSFDGPSAA
jgi:hypothetical protein